MYKTIRSAAIRLLALPEGPPTPPPGGTVVRTFNASRRYLHYRLLGTYLGAGIVFLVGVGVGNGFDDTLMDDVTDAGRGVDAHSVPAGQGESLDRARRRVRRTVGTELLEVDPALDGDAAGRGYVRLREPDLGQRRAGGDPQLGGDQVDAGDLLGDGVLDLDARVDLDEIELPGSQLEPRALGEPDQDRIRRGRLADNQRQQPSCR